MKANRFFILNCGTEIGPVHHAEILRLWENGEIQANSLISDSSFQEEPDGGERFDQSHLFRQMGALKSRAQIPPSLLLWELQEQLEEVRRETTTVKRAMRFGFLIFLLPLIWMAFRLVADGQMP